MGMTMTQKILAAHAGLESVTAGQLIEAKLDIVMANDIKMCIRDRDINRSTFYLHFKDIQDLLREIEENMEAQIKRAIEEHPIVSGNENAFYFIEDMFRVLDEEREISKALIGPNGDMGFIHRIERIIKENSRGTLEKMFPGKKEDLKYFYAFCLSGCLGLVKVWLNEGEEKSPEEMAQMTFNMIANAKDAFCQTASDFLDK